MRNNNAARTRLNRRAVPMIAGARTVRAGAGESYSDLAAQWDPFAAPQANRDQSPAMAASYVLSYLASDVRSGIVWQTEIAHLLQSLDAALA